VETTTKIIKKSRSELGGGKEKRFRICGKIRTVVAGVIRRILRGGGNMTGGFVCKNKTLGPQMGESAWRVLEEGQENEAPGGRGGGAGNLGLGGRPVSLTKKKRFGKVRMRERRWKYSEGG